MAGRFELGFRLNEGSLEDISAMKGPVEYSASVIAKQILEADLRIELTDGRKLTRKFSNAMDALRDGWIFSSTKTKALKTYDIESVGSNYVGVGRPFVFIRAGQKTKLGKERQMRTLLDQDGLEFFITRSGLHGQHFDTAVTPSKTVLDNETAKERLARLFYTQIRTLAFAHSFYLRQVSSGRIAGSKSLEPAVQALLERLATLSPVEGQQDDELTCDELKEILKSSNVDVRRLAREIEAQINLDLSRLHSGL